MKNLNSYKKIAKEFIKEAAWDRKFGEPLPTLSSVMEEASDDDKVIGKNDQNRDVTIRQALDSTSDNSTMKFLKKKAQRFKDTGDTSVFTRDSGDNSKGKDIGGSDSDDNGGKPKGNDDSGDDKKDSGGKLGGSDFDRDSDDKGDEPKKLSSVGNGGKIDDMIAKATKDAGLDDWQRVSDNSKEVDNFSSWEEYESHLKDVAEKQKQRDEPKGDEEPKKLSSDEIDTKVDDLGKEIFSIYHSGMSDQDKERYIDGLQKQIDDLKSQKESIKVIDGKKYKAIKESKEPTKSTIHPFKKTYKKIGGK